MGSTDVFSFYQLIHLDNFGNFLKRQASLVSYRSPCNAKVWKGRRYDANVRRVSRGKTRQKSETDYAGERMEILFAERTVVSAPLLLGISSGNN
jgi:hypothetical protein